MKYSPPKTTTIVPANFARPADGARWTPVKGVRDIPISGEPAWQSNGGPYRGHPARSRPYSLDAEIPRGLGQLVRIYVVGVFAQWADVAEEEHGTLGSSVQLLDDRDCLFRQDLLNGRHYVNACAMEPLYLVLGDGTSIETVGRCQVADADLRVDLLTIDVPNGIVPQTLRFKDVDTPAAFLIFDIAFEFQQEPGCPFKSRSGGISLAELGAIVRVGDRLKLGRALDQLELAMGSAEDLDEARGEALTFLAVVSAATIEMGGPREVHRVQLEAARRLDQLTTGTQIAQYIRSCVEHVLGDLLSHSDNPSSQLVDRALAIVDRNFARGLTDATVAAQLGLSTSHFRFLFKQATGQPFHKYLISMRLEKAKQMLLERELPVSEVASAVGFTGLSHFSRAFAQRFSVSPTSLRRLGR